MIQEILDEVLDTSLQPDVNPRYVIKDNNGKVINDNVQIDLKTPVVQNPTPLNKATLANIQGDLYTQDRYNVPAVGYDGTNYVFNIDLPLTSYESGKIVNLQGTAFGDVTSFNNPYISINQLGITQILGQIRAGKYYNLVFNGAVWLPQVTNIGVGSEPIVITESGTYEVDPDVQYKVIAVGGGGGALVHFSEYYWKFDGAAGGGSAGKIEDIFVPESSMVNVVIGSAGNKAEVRDAGSAASGGNTTIGKFIAYGGEGAKYASDGSGEYDVQGGKGGSYAGGVGFNGEDGSFWRSFGDYSGTGGEGWVINGVSYGRGGSIEGDEDKYEVTSPSTQGVVILYPLI